MRDPFLVGIREGKSPRRGAQPRISSGEAGAARDAGRPFKSLMVREKGRRGPANAELTGALGEAPPWPGVPEEGNCNLSSPKKKISKTLDFREVIPS